MEKDDFNEFNSGGCGVSDNVACGDFSDTAAAQAEIRTDNPRHRSEVAQSEKRGHADNGRNFVYFRGERVLCGRNDSIRVHRRGLHGCGKTRACGVGFGNDNGGFVRLCGLSRRLYQGSQKAQRGTYAYPKNHLAGDDNRGVFHDDLHQRLCKHRDFVPGRRAVGYGLVLLPGDGTRDFVHRKRG